MNLSGKWMYNEDFDEGVSTGVLNLLHVDDDKLVGDITILESSFEAAPFYVKEMVEGIVIGTKVILKSTSCEIINGTNFSEYFLDSWEGQLNSEGQIVGYSIDTAGVCGVFLLKRANE